MYIFKDFDDIANNLVQKILDRNQESFGEYTRLILYLNPMIVRSNSTYCSIDLSNFYYSKAKFNQLLRWYIDLDSLVAFKESLKSHKAVSRAYYFKVYHGSKGAAMGEAPCLISFTVTRKKREEPWTEAFVNFRISDINKKLPGDLVLIRKVLEFLELEDTIKTVYFIFPKSYIAVNYLCSQLDKIHLPPECDFSNMVKNQYQYYKTHDGFTYSLNKKIQKIINKELHYPKVDIRELKIGE